MTTLTTRGISHIIWDWNGTLLNDKWLCIESINTLLLQRGLAPIDENRYAGIFGFPVKSYYERAGFDFTSEPYEKPAMEFIRLYDERRTECALQPGAQGVLEAVRRLGIGQSLLSASEKGVLEEMTAHHGIRGYFDHLKGLNDHYAHGKEDLGRELMLQIGCRPEEVLMVGDTCHDSEVAAALGLECILYTGGHHPEDRLMRCGRILLNRLEAIPELLIRLQAFH
ncbi:MAG: HAD hydrolase-like protein [Bacteroidales bacterium]